MQGNNLFLTKIRESAGMRICVLFGSLFVLLVFTSIITELIKSYSGLDERNSLLIASFVQAFLVFMVPAFLTAKYSSARPIEWLRLNRSLNFRNVAGVIIVYFLFLPAMNQLISWNESITFPESLSSLESVLRGWEDNGQGTTDTLLSAQGIVSMIVGVLIIGVVTGFSEEVFFRGAMQKIFKGTSLGPIAAIWVSAFIFSAFHFQFFGFFPRFLMGAFFGYLVWWTRSLWVPVFAHALNNSMVVISAYLYGDAMEDSILETVGVAESGIPWVALISAALTLIFLNQFRLYFFPGRKLRHAS